MNNYSERVLKFLQSEPFRTFKAKEISRKLKIPQQDYSKLRNALKSLVRQGAILRLDKNRYGVGKAAAEVIGRLHVNAQGYGFVIPDEGDDVFISQKNMGKALHRDIVRVRLFANSSGQRQEGKVIEVVERLRTAIVGTFRKGRRNAYVIPDDLKIPKDIIIDPRSKGGARDGQKVVVKIEEWEGEYGNPYGSITQVLGYPDEPGVDILSIFYDHSLPLAFPKNVEDEASGISEKISPQELAGRLDLRDLEIITIDPADAKDFDDAISLETLDNGNWRLGVHIADVSHYVKVGSEIDKEATERGTSVYLVDRVVPMLPEKLSNSICSLVQGSDKLCYSVLMELDSGAKLLNYSIRETVIRSSKRFTYEEAQGVLDGNRSPFADLLRNMHKVYRLLAARRHRRGSIDFDTLELDIELDESGYPVAIKRKLRQDTNRMIEEFMLLANETIARHIGVHLAQERGEPLPFVYRIHEKPDAQSIQELVAQVNAFGINVKAPKRTTPHFFYKLSKMIKDHPASPILESAMLRAMMKARYSTENVGHFGLAYRYYTHFTSPIRRYPDLLVHRLLKHYYGGKAKPAIKQEQLEKMCKVASEREIVAQTAERDTVKLKQVEYMERHLGEEFEGYISRIVNFGFFVHLPDILADGLVHVTTLDDDYYIYDEKTYSMIGSLRNRRYRLGDKVRVRVAKVDRNERIIDFVLC